MKILWVAPLFLHPTTKGGQIRTLETLRQLHRWHEIHYAGLSDPATPEGVERAHEYASVVHAVEHVAPRRGSGKFFGQLAGNLFSPLPLAVSRFAPKALRSLVSELMAREKFDRVVCDFLAAAPSIEHLEQAVLFQHNVETIIWERHTEHAPSWLHRQVYGMQAERMRRYEEQVCRRAAHVIAVSEPDAQRMREMFGINKVSAVPTGVDTDYFAPPAEAGRERTGLVFVGSMDWQPNVDGVKYFVEDILPRIRRQRPDCRLAIVGRQPSAEIRAMAERDPGLIVTGTVEDVRPYLWEAQVCIVPLRIGGGTRLKIYEAMAAGVPVVSTSVGAEGLPLNPGEHLSLADDADSFAAECVNLLADRARAGELAERARELVTSRFSWEQAARQFERVLVEATAAAVR